MRALLSLVLVYVLASNAAAQKFYGDATLRPLDGRRMEVATSFGFIDVRGRKWEAPAGHKTDGASIPRLLWSIVGSPFTGRYLKAAVLHDVYCELKSRDWKEVHGAFYEAMIADGVERIQAKAMFAAVYRFGPRWVVDRFYSCPPGYSCASPTPIYIDWVRHQPEPNTKSVEEFAKLVELIKNKDISLGQIIAVADRGYYTETGYRVSGQLVRGTDPVCKFNKCEWNKTVMRMTGEVQRTTEHGLDDYVEHVQTLISGRHGDFRANPEHREMFLPPPMRK